MSKWDLQWSPFNEDTFVAFTSDKHDLNLYKFVDGGQDNNRNNSQFSSDLYSATKPDLLASKGDLYMRNKDDLQHIKCFAFCPVPTAENVIAVGLSNGKVAFTSFRTDATEDNNNLIGTELLSRVTRPCTGLAWNHADPYLLAISHEKHKSTTNASLSIWNPRIGENRVTERTMWPMTDSSLGPSDNVNSMAWLHQPHHCLACGFGGKIIKVYDIRSDVKTGGFLRSSTSTKAVYGISPNQHVDHQLASFSEDQLYIWDLRRFDKAVLTIKEPHPIQKIQWSPTRKNILVSLTKDSSAIKLYSVEHVDNEVEYLERLIQPFGRNAVSNFSLHPSRENSVLVVSPSSVMQNIVIQDVISFSLNPLTSVSFASGRSLLHASNEENSLFEDDISTTMRQRAIDGYGEMDPLHNNALLLGDGDNRLKYLWNWLSRMKKMQRMREDTLTIKEKKAGDDRLPYRKAIRWCYGVKSVIKGEILEDVSKSSIDVIKWEGINTWTEFTVYRSKERSHAITLCEWPTDGTSLGEFLQDIEKRGDYERAAAIAVFRSKGRMAIDILNRGSEHPRGRSANFNAVAMALAGMTTNKKSLWCEMCSSLCKQLENPYLRAMFGFLTTSEGSKYNSVLKERDISLEDRLAFACTYLNDANLATYIDELTLDVIYNGYLNGVLLTGLTKDGIDLLQSYLDLTSDIQSVSCIMSHATLYGLTEGLKKRVKHWIDTYRNLLDLWQLWHKRAKFDMAHHYRNSSASVAPQIVVNCHFCNHPISPAELGSKSFHSRSHRIPMRSGYTTFKVKGCYICRKSLPRCSLCLLNMGTSSLSWKLLPPNRRTNQSGGGDNKDTTKETDFGDWFTWCQSCRHGGHANHLMEWFKEHNECPVAACKCTCMALDSVSMVSMDEETDS